MPQQSSLPSSVIVWRSNHRHLYSKETQEDIQNSLAPRGLSVTMFGGERRRKAKEKEVRKSCNSLFTWAEGKDEFELCQNPKNSDTHVRRDTDYRCQN